MPESVMIDAVRYAIQHVKEPLILDGRICNAVVDYNTAQIKMLEDGFNPRAPQGARPQKWT